MFDITPIQENDQEWFAKLLVERWDSPKVVSRGQLHHADQLPGFVAWSQDKPVGVITYHTVGIQCEIVTINSLHERKGIGRKLIEAIISAARTIGCERIWLTTTNDNIPALVFYQKIGFRLAALHIDAINSSRNLKPEIPDIGYGGIPIRDEIELEYWLN
ncbi:MAG: GNAT family N-acetyltransferase [Anaerolineales bacterium]|nr:GNAT family N-acetyltransferase [Chloroflexota bacterium]MBL6983124.1 GNAT family N-acetyltransferase [Anaerolineales bacterium]